MGAATMNCYAWRWSGHGEGRVDGHLDRKTELGSKTVQLYMLPCNEAEILQQSSCGDELITSESVMHVGRHNVVAGHYIQPFWRHLTPKT